MFVAFAAAIVLLTPGTPTGTTAAAGMQTLGMAILARARIAAGGPAVATIRTLHIRERVTSLGMAGEGDEWDDVLSGRFAQKLSGMGPLSGTQAFDGTNAWIQDATGLAHFTNSGNDIANALTQAYTASLSYWFPQRVAGTAVYTGKKKIGDRTYFVVRARPQGGYPIDLWFDSTNYLLTRAVVTASPTRSSQTDFSDYRTVAGCAMPFNVQIQDSQGNSFGTVVTRIETNAAVASHFTMPTTEPRDFTLAAGAAGTTIPIELVNNHIYLDAMVDGKGPFHFVFDTGGQGVLNPDVAASLGIHPAGVMQAGGAGAGTVQTGFAWVPSVQLGKATMTHQSFAILPLGPVMQAIEGVHIDGMVGYETVARYLITIDYAKSTMTLSLPKPGVVPPGIAVPFVFYETVPQFHGAVDGIPGVFIVDTGNRSSLVLTSPFVAKHGLVKRYKSPVAGITGYGIGGPSSAILTRVKSLVVGSIDVPNVVTSLSTDKMGAMSDPSISGNVGGGFLKRFIVTFDYRNQIMYLRKNADFAKTDIVDRSGLVLVAGHAGIRAIGVLSATPASRAGMHAGDVISTVNGAPASALGLARIRELLRGPAGTKVRLTVLSSGQTHAVTLTLADYV